MRARIDISEVEAETKIRAKYLRALENEEWDLLPGPTFVKSFLRTYADALGLDSRALVEEYKLRHERLSEVDLQPITPRGAAAARDRRDRRARGPGGIPRAYLDLGRDPRRAGGGPGGHAVGGGGGSSPSSIGRLRPRRRRDDDHDFDDRGQCRHACACSSCRPASVKRLPGRGRRAHAGRRQDAEAGHGAARHTARPSSA